LAAFFSGLGHLTRQDGILLLATILTCILLAPLPVKRKLILSVGVLGIHLVVFSPLMIKNYQEMGFLMPPGPPMTRYLTEHDDVYAYNTIFNFQTYLQFFGWKGILNNKLQTATFHAAQAYAMLNPGFVILAILAIGNALLFQRNKQRLLFILPALIYSIFTYGFYTLIASFALFSAQKCLVTLIPFLSILIMDFVAQRLRYRPLLIGVWIGLTFYLGVQGYARAAWSNSHYDSTYASIRATQLLILEDAQLHGQQPSTIIVMTRNPWQFNEATGWHSLMVPNNELDTIFTVADLYQATHLILPASRPALDAIYNGKAADPRLEYLGAVGEQKIFRFQQSP
jgi:hypothetical protein